MISAIVLAAEKNERSGEQKLFLPFRGKPVLQWVLETLLASRVLEVICVVRHLAAMGANLPVADERLYWIVNDPAHDGQNSSMIAGLWGVDARSEGALFVIADRPMVGSAMIDGLIERFDKVSAPIVAPRFQGRFGNPVLFRRDVFSELLRLDGHGSEQAVIENHRNRIESVDWHQATPFMEIDENSIA